ncbi:MAG: HTH-type transcriptional regulator CynR [Glaciecola sp. HTCC2999]|jgi:LysR family carnitine catabolism transcriptional activator|nr:MAG: HTH-type transcriptional regulator CynR [Glaciecola sp. HTCC2999]
MALSFKQLQAFLTMAHSHNFAEAATKMHVTQPALSSAIKKCEDILGGELFARTTRTVSLTKEGETFLPIAQRLYTEYQDAIEQIQAVFAKQVGSLNVAAMPSFAERYLPEYLFEFHAMYPNISIKIEDVVVEKVIDLVQAGKVECGFSFEPKVNSDMTFTPLFTEQFVVVMHANHPLNDAKHTTLALNDIASFDVVVMNKNSNLRVFIDSVYKEQGIEPKIIAEASQIGTLGQLVKQQIGIAIVPQLSSQRMEELGLVCCRLNEAKLQRKVGIITNPYQQLSVTTQAFLRIVES